MTEIVVYVDVAAGEGQSPDSLADLARVLPGVTGVNSQVEQAERGAEVMEAITSITLILTAASGAVGAASLLLDRLKNLVKSAEGFRNAWVQTPKGTKTIDEVTADDFGESDPKDLGTKSRPRNRARTSRPSNHPRSRSRRRTRPGSA